MNRLLTALLLATVLISPAFAQDAAKGVTCSAFVAMSHDDQKAAMEMVMITDAMATKAMMATEATTAKGGAMAADATTTTDGAMATDDAVTALVKMCNNNPDRTIMDAMHSMN